MLYADDCLSSGVIHDSQPEHCACKLRQCGVVGCHVYVSVHLVVSL